MKRFERPYTSDEIVLLKSRKYSLWEHFEHFGLKMVGITLVLLAPLLAYDKFVEEVSSNTQLYYSIPVLLIAVSLVLFWMHKNGELAHNRIIKMEIKQGKAQVTKIKTDHVVKRKDPEDFGPGYYIKINEGQTLYLQGQYLYEFLYRGKFPNSHFELVSTSMNDKLLDIAIRGRSLKPKRTLKAFSKEQYQKGEAHSNGDLLDIPIDEIV